MHLAMGKGVCVLVFAVEGEEGAPGGLSGPSGDGDARSGYMGETFGPIQ